MRRKNNPQCAMTLVEMLVAMAIMVIVMAAVVPQIRSIRSSWDSKAKNVEAIQNGRVLVDHIASQLTEANSIAAVSDSNETNGYIQFLNNDGNTMRYEIDASNYVVYGPVGNLSELTGPVSQLQFTCYDACDLDTAITDVNSIRTVKVQTTLTNSTALGRNQSFTAQAYLRTNSAGGSGGGQTVTKQTSLECDSSRVPERRPALARIDDNHYLCAYKGRLNDGYAVVLTVDPATWTISKGIPYEYDTSNGEEPALCQIDSTHYLCAYTGYKDDGWAVVLTVDPATWEITKGMPLEHDIDQGRWSALAKIDSSHYLLAYSGQDMHGWAVILTVDPATWTITKGIPFEYDALQAEQADLAEVDNTHYLCVYRGDGADGWATILTVNTGDWTITQGTPFEYDLVQGEEAALAQIDSTRYLCVYVGFGTNGWANILTVNTGDWTISKGTAFEYDPDQSESLAIIAIGQNDYLCTYAGWGRVGQAVVLTADVDDGTVTKGTSSTYDDNKGWAPALAKIDDTHYLCAYEGLASALWACIFSTGSAILP